MTTLLPVELNFCLLKTKLIVRLNSLLLSQWSFHLHRELDTLSVELDLYYFPNVQGGDHRCHFKEFMYTKKEFPKFIGGIIDFANYRYKYYPEATIQYLTALLESIK